MLHITGVYMSGRALDLLREAAGNDEKVAWPMSLGIGKHSGLIDGNHIDYNNSDIVIRPLTPEEMA